MIEVAMEKCLLDMPCEILLEIFRRLPNDKLFKISRLCPKFRDAAGDRHLWKNVCIMYKARLYAFEELYSEPWPVKAIDLSDTKIIKMIPVSWKTDQVVKVTKLNLSYIEANEVTKEAILTKYQCTELRLNFGWIDPHAFSKQTRLEMLSLVCPKYLSLDPLWLAQVLSNCKKLKTLDLSEIHLTKRDMHSFVKNLPTSLEKLFLHNDPFENNFVKSLSESAPNLKELELSFPKVIECPSLLEFQFLEVLHIIPSYSVPNSYQYMNASHTHLIKFPALKAIHILHDPSRDQPGSDLGELRSMLEPHGIIVVSVSSVKPWLEVCNYPGKYDKKKNKTKDDNYVMNNEE